MNVQPANQVRFPLPAPRSRSSGGLYAACFVPYNFFSYFYRSSCAILRMYHSSIGIFVVVGIVVSGEFDVLRWFSSRTGSVLFVFCFFCNLGDVTFFMGVAFGAVVW